MQKLSGKRLQSKKLVYRKLAEVKTGEYVRATVRIASCRVSHGYDELGRRTAYTGVFEDETGRIPFICYNLKLPLIRNSIVEVQGAYVVNVNGRKMMVLGEGSRVTVLDETLDKYIWRTSISDLKEPMKSVVIKGRIKRVLGAVVKRCAVCGRIIYGSCGAGHRGYVYDLRLSFILNDGSGSIKCIVNRRASCKLLNLPISAVYDMMYSNSHAARFILRLRDVRVVEYQTFRKLDGYFFDERRGVVVSFDFDRPDLEGGAVKMLDLNSFRNQLLAEDLLEYYLNRKMRLEEFLGIKVVKKSNLGGTIRVDGFKLNIDYCNGFSIDCIPVSKVFRPVSEYVKYRRSGGASFKSIKRSLISRNNVVYLYPRGATGRIVDVIPASISEYTVGDTTLYDYWRRKGVYLNPDEKPVIRVFVYDYGLTLDYPPSLVYHELESKYLAEWKCDKIVEIVKRPLEEIPGAKVEVYSGYDDSIERIALGLTGKHVSLKGDVVLRDDKPIFLVYEVLDVD